MRPAGDAIRPRHRRRWKSRLYMDGPALMSFTVEAVPKLIDQVLGKSQKKISNMHFLLFHQATAKMLLQLQETLGVDSDFMPIRLRDIGNTVSCTLPILIHDLRERATN